MDEDRLRKLMQNEDLIPGIFDFCDRWCEKCQLTQHCLFYSFSDKVDEDMLGKVDTEVFWEEFEVAFEATMKMLNEMAMEAGVQLLNPQETAASLKVDEALMPELHPVAKTATNYGNWVEMWKRQHLEFLQTDPPSIPEIHPVTEVIFYYQHQIYVKIVQALGIDPSQATYEEEIQLLVAKKNGTAKVALIEIDRSIAAWGKISDFFPEEIDEILDILLVLIKLREQLEILFPFARTFIRPGFDAA